MEEVIKIAGDFDDSMIGQIEVYSRPDVAALRQRAFERCHLEIVDEGELFVVIQLFGRHASIKLVELAESQEAAEKWIEAERRGGEGAGLCWASRLVDDPYWPARHAMHLEEVAS